MIVAGIEDAEEVAVAQAANVAAGGIAASRFTRANDLVLGRGGGCPEE